MHCAGRSLPDHPGSSTPPEPVPRILSPWWLSSLQVHQSPFHPRASGQDLPSVWKLLHSYVSCLLHWAQINHIVFVKEPAPGLSGLSVCGLEVLTIVQCVQLCLCNNLINICPSCMRTKADSVFAHLYP